MIGYLVFAFVVVAANAAEYDARLTSYGLNAWKLQQQKLKEQNGLITGVFKKVPPGTYIYDWNNEIFTIPRDATKVTVINHDTNTVQMLVGVKGSHSGNIPWKWVPEDVNQQVEYNYNGVNFQYFRSGTRSRITIDGPVNPVKDGSTQYNLCVVAAKGEQGSYGLADIQFSYTAYKEVVATKYDAQIQSYDLNAWKQQQAKLKAQDGLIKGEYKKVAQGSYSGDYRNEIATLPRGATNVKIMNYNTNTVQLLVGIKGSHSASTPYYWTRVDGDLNRQYTINGITLHYSRTGTRSYVTIKGPVNPVKDGSTKFNMVVSAKEGKLGSYGLANIEFSYTANKEEASTKYDAQIQSYDLNAWKQQQAKLKAQDGLIKGEYKKVPQGSYSGDYRNEIATLPRGATNVKIMNYNTNTVQLLVGIKGSHSASTPYHWTRVNGDLNRQYTIYGITLNYSRSGTRSYVTIKGPANPVKDGSTKFNMVVSAKEGKLGSYGLANIEFSYVAHKSAAASP